MNWALNWFGLSVPRGPYAGWPVLSNIMIG